MMTVSMTEKDVNAGGTDRHIPVLLEPVLDALFNEDSKGYVKKRPDQVPSTEPEKSPTSQQRIFIDGTFGAGGYSRGILTSLQDESGVRVIGIDQDPDAVRDARGMLKEFGPRLDVVHGRYSDMENVIAGLGVSQVDGVVLDIGVSSMQLDQDRRGFSFRRDGPLDMRMSQSGPTAADLVNGLAEEEIANVLYKFGEEKKSRYIARAIVERRVSEPFRTTTDLAQVIEAVVYKKAKDKIHPATRSFQALRIYLNDELGELLRGLNAASRILKPGGRLVVVCFHSLEDRIVKNYFRSASGRVPNQSRHLPEINKECLPSFQIINPKAVKANDEEMSQNKRARSALLRSGVRTEAPPLEFFEADLGIKSLQL
jgi:16S rRNA (cytosine1402-N4)-methyltransferase